MSAKAVVDDAVAQRAGAWPPNFWIEAGHLDRLFRSALPGELVVYHVGFLSMDRYHSAMLEKTARRAMRLACPKNMEPFPITAARLIPKYGLALAELTQRRVGERGGIGVFEYRITKHAGVEV